MSKILELIAWWGGVSGSTEEGMTKSDHRIGSSLQDVIGQVQIMGAEAADKQHE